jgi:hypothetical protein
MSEATRHLGRCLLLLGLTVVLASCGQAEESPTAPQSTVASAIASTTTAPTSTSEIDSTTTIQNIGDLPEFAPLEAKTYFIDPADDPSTPLRVMYTIPEEGWLMWIGTVKREEGEDRAVMVSITTVSNLMVDACVDQRPADPPIGPTVDDLAAGLAELPPFQVTKPPTDVTVYGYSGKHLELTIPDDLPYDPDGGSWTDCGRGELQSWIGTVSFDYFYGYSPDQVEEFWILDVDGTRLMIQAKWFPESPPQDIAEMRAILDSIRIEP